jgi:hypothetical protein
MQQYTYTLLRVFISGSRRQQDAAGYMKFDDGM